jgi:hypothetical protein
MPTVRIKDKTGSVIRASCDRDIEFLIFYSREMVNDRQSENSAIVN